MVIESLLKGSLNGVGKVHKTPIFPCGIFQYMKGVNDKPGTPNYYLYKLALESTSKRLYPNYCNVDWSVQSSWEQDDINQRQSYIDSLSIDDYKKLINLLQTNPELQNILGLVIEDC